MDDQEPRIRISECLLIGADISYGEDLSVLQVSRRKGATMTVLNTFFGKEAEDLYFKLTGDAPVPVEINDPLRCNSTGRINNMIPFNDWGSVNVDDHKQNKNNKGEENE